MSLQDMKDDPAETSPLLSVDAQQQDDDSRLDAIAALIINRSLNTETDAVFTKEEILEAMALTTSTIDPSIPLEDAATQWISALGAANALPIVYHNQDEEILHILAQQTSNLTNQPSTSVGTTADQQNGRPHASDLSTSSGPSTHSSHSKRSRKKKRQQIEEMKLKIAKRIATKCINQDNGERYSFQYILNEINDLEFNIRLDRSVEQQGITSFDRLCPLHILILSVCGYIAILRTKQHLEFIYI